MEYEIHLVLNTWEIHKLTNLLEGYLDIPYAEWPEKYSCLHTKLVGAVNRNDPEYVNWLVHNFEAGK